jgi:hypothetical protein
MAMFESSTTIRGETSVISLCGPQGGGGPGKMTLQIYVRYLVSSPCVVNRAALKPNGRYRNYMVAAVAPLHRA